jgi:hypothetical protein
LGGGATLRPADVSGLSSGGTGHKWRRTFRRTLTSGATSSSRIPVPESSIFWHALPAACRGRGTRCVCGGLGSRGRRPFRGSRGLRRRVSIPRWVDFSSFTALVMASSLVLPRLKSLHFQKQAYTVLNKFAKILINFDGDFGNQSCCQSR